MRLKYNGTKPVIFFIEVSTRKMWYDKVWRKNLEYFGRKLNKKGGHYKIILEEQTVKNMWLKQ